MTSGPFITQRITHPVVNLLCFWFILTNMSRGSRVGTMTRPLTGRSGIRIAAEAMNGFLLQESRMALRTIQPPIQVVPCFF